MSSLPRVLSYPPVHDYVDRLEGSAATLVHRDQPWPRLPDLYDPAWIGGHADDWDVAHLHFTWEQYRAERLEAVLEAHAAAGKRVVWTAHDLRNPHTSDVSHDDEYLRLLAEFADVVVTLTPGAAVAIRDRFGRDAEVIPHGPLVPPEVAHTLRLNRDGERPLEVFLLAKTLRANLDWLTPMEVVSQLGRSGTPIAMTVYLQQDAVRRDEVIDRTEPPAVVVEVGERLPKTELWDRVAAADVLLLPYRWGTHSGLLELAIDLGTQPVVGHVGYLSQQAPCHLVRVEDRRVDGDHLTQVLSELASGARRLDPVPMSLRERTLKEFVAHHGALYSRLSSSPGTAVNR